MLWIDITDTFSAWHGSPNGIQRVLSGLASATGSRVDCGLCVWDKGNDCWRELPSEGIELITLGNSSQGYTKAYYIFTDVLAFLLLHLRAAARGAMHAVSRAEATITSAEKPSSFRVPFTKPMVRFKAFRKSSTTPDAQRDAFVRNLPKIDFSRGMHAVLFADSHWNTPGILDALNSQPGAPAVIGFVHDVIPLERPDFVSDRSKADFQVWLDEMQRSCHQMLCNSQYSANRLAASFSPVGPKPPVRAIKFGNAINVSTGAPHKERRLGDVCQGQSAEAIAMPEHVSEATSWYLWVGSLDIRKNIDVLLLAVEGLARRGLMKRPLVIVGRRSTGSVYYRHKIDRNPILRQWIVHMEAAPDELLHALQTQAALFLFTSWEEGYGLPVAEALQAGIPVIASNATSIPEVAGDLVDYFEPWNSGQLAALIERFESDPNYREDLKARAARFVPTSWNETIDDIMSGLPRSTV